MRMKRVEVLLAVNGCVWMANVGVITWWLLEWAAGMAGR